MALPTRLEGAMLPNLSITWTDDDGTARTLSGTITGYMTNVNTGVTTEIEGSLTADADQVTNQGVFVWDVHANDVDTAGEYNVYFVETISGEPYKSIPQSWKILDAPTP